MTTTEELKMARDALALNADLDPQTPIVERLAKTRAALAAIDAIPQHDAQPNCHSTRPDVAPPSRPDDYCTDIQCRVMGRCRYAAPAADIDEAQLARLSERGAVAWAGVDAQALREGVPSGEPAYLANGEQAFRADIVAGWPAHNRASFATPLFHGAPTAQAPQAAHTAAARAVPAPAPSDMEDPVMVPRGLIGAACSALDFGREAPKTLAELRRYTIGDRSGPAAAAPQAQVRALTDAQKDQVLADVVGLLSRQHEWLTRVAAINLVAGLYGRAGAVLAAPSQQGE